MRLHLAPHERLRHLLPDVAAPDTRLVARLVDTGDDLATDDRAYAVVPGIARARVLRVGDPDLFLDGALLSLGDSVSVHRRAARDVEATRASWSQLRRRDLRRRRALARARGGHFIYLDPHGPGEPVRRARRRCAIRSSATCKKGHALLRHLSLADLNIGEAHRLALAAGDEAVASALDAPLILTRARPELRIVALAFDIRRSDLPMRAAFPLLLVERARLAGRARPRPRPRACAPAAACAWCCPTGARQRRRDRHRSRAARPTPSPRRRGAIEIPIAHTGFYRVGRAHDAGREPGRRHRVRHHARRAAWSLAARRWSRPIRRCGARAGRSGGGRSLAAAALSLAEWWTYHRRWTV